MPFSAVRSAKRKTSIVLLTALLAAPMAWWSASAEAQTQPAPQLEIPDPDRKAEPAPQLPDTGETLGERLDRSDGVIKPPEGVAPDMRVPPKDPGAGATMPVIPPPGAPGGDPSVKPK
jgi:hypothetical protein